MIKSRDNNLIKSILHLAMLVSLFALGLAVLVYAFLHVGGSSNDGQRLTGAIGISGLLGQFGIEFLDKMPSTLAWVVVGGAGVAALIIIIVVIVLLLKAFRGKGKSGGAHSIGFEAHGDGSDGYPPNTMMYLQQGQGLGGNGIDMGYMPMDNTMQLGQTVHGNPYMRGVPNVNLARMSVAELLGFDVDSPLLPNANSLDDATRRVREGAVANQRITKINEETNKLNLLLSQNKKIVDAKNAELGHIDAELQQLYAIVQDAPKRDVPAIEADIAHKEEILDAGDEELRQLNVDMQSIGSNLNALEIYRRKLSALVDSVGNALPSGATAGRSKLDSELSNRLDALLKNANLLTAQIQKYDEDIDRRNKEKEVIKADNNSIQLRLLSATSSADIAAFGLAVDKNNGKLADIEGQNSLDMRSKLDASNEYDRIYKEVNAFIDGSKIAYADVVRQEDKALAEVKFTMMQRENDELFQKSQADFNEAQLLFDTCNKELEQRVAQVVADTTRDIADQEAEIARLNAQIQSVNDNLKYAPDSEKAVLAQEKSGLEKTLRDAGRTLENIKSNGLKLRIDTKDKLEKALSDAKNNLDKRRRDVENASYRIKSALPMDKVAALVASGSGIISAERKSAEDKKARVAAQEAALSAKLANIDNEKSLELNKVRVLQQDLAAAQQGDDGAKKRIETELLSRMSEDEVYRYDQMSSAEKWRYAMIEAEERMRRASYDADYKIAALYAENELRRAQFDAENALSEARAQAEEVRAEAEEQVARAQSDADEARRKASEFESSFLASKDITGELESVREQLALAQIQAEVQLAEVQANAEESRSVINAELEVARLELEEARQRLDEEMQRAADHARESGDEHYAARMAAEEQLESARRELDDAQRELNYTQRELETMRESSGTSEYVENAKRLAEEELARTKAKLEEAVARADAAANANDSEHYAARRAAEEEAERARTELDNARRLADAEVERVRTSAENRAREDAEKAQENAERARAELDNARRLADEEVERVRLEAEEAKRELDNARRLADEEVERVRLEAEDRAREDAEEAKRAAEQRVEDAMRELEDVRSRAAQELEDVRTLLENRARDEAEQARRELEQELESTRRELEYAKKDAERDIERIRSEAEAMARDEADNARRAAAEELERARAEVAETRRLADQIANDIRQESEEAVSEARRRADDDIERIRQEMIATAENGRLSREEEEALRQMRQEEEERILAQAEEDRLARLEEVNAAEAARAEAEDELRRARDDFEEQSRLAKEQSSKSMQEAEELVAKMRADFENVQQELKDKEEKLETEKKDREEREKRIAQKVALRRTDINRLKEQLVEAKDVGGAKTVAEKLTIIKEGLDEEERSSFEFVEFIDRAIIEANHAGELLDLREQLKKRPQSKDRKIVKKYTERVRRVAPPKKRRAGASAARRPGARPRPPMGARPAGARPPMARPMGARPLGARPMGARPPMRPLGARPPMARPAGARPPMARPMGARPVARPTSPPRR